jgi:hypothetical protein
MAQRSGQVNFHLATHFGHFQLMGSRPQSAPAQAERYNIDWLRTCVELRRCADSDDTFFRNPASARCIDAIIRSGAKHLIHGACWENFPASSTLSLDGAADEVALVHSHALQTETASTGLAGGSQQTRRRCRKSKRDLTLTYVLCLFFSRHKSRRVHQIMIRTGSDRKLTELSEAEQQAKDLKRLLVKAEQQIRKLQEKVADQKHQIRELQSQAKHEDGLAADREELKAEIADLKGEIKELTRANREHVGKIETVRAENAKLKAGAKLPSTSIVGDQTDLREAPQPLLS